MEKHYGSSGRYTCNGYVPLPQQVRRRRDRLYVGRLVIWIVIFIIMWAMIWAIGQVPWLQYVR